MHITNLFLYVQAQLEADMAASSKASGLNLFSLSFTRESIWTLFLKFLLLSNATFIFTNHHVWMCGQTCVRANDCFFFWVIDIVENSW